MIAEAVKAKYPDFTVCGTVGPGRYPSSDYIEGWKYAKENKKVIDMVDEHYYESPGWFMHNQDYYDGYDRTAPKVFLGEYASQDRTMENALVEALYLCSLERNGDVVRMASYAPLFCNEEHQDWNPDMIYFNRDSITTLTPSYYTQKMWGNNSGDEYVSSSFDLPKAVGYRVGASVVKNNAGQTIVKLVNTLPQSLTVSIKGLSVADGTVAEGFGGKPESKQVEAVKTTVEGQKVTLPAYSVVVIRK